MTTVTVEEALEEIEMTMMITGQAIAPPASGTGPETTVMMTARDAEAPLPGLNIVMIEMTDDLLTVLPGAMTAGTDEATATETETIGEETAMTATAGRTDEMTATDAIPGDETIAIEVDVMTGTPVPLLAIE